VTTDGYLDTPAKYRDVAGLTSGREEEQEMLEEMMEGTSLQYAFTAHRRTGRLAWLTTLFVSPKCATNPTCIPANLIYSYSVFPDLRPAKRRKTFTDSVVSTAYSAALISTAVGFTVYK
jgi:hypothetical protein